MAAGACSLPHITSHLVLVCNHPDCKDYEECWPTQHQLNSAGAWHIFNSHKKEWQELAGNTRPRIMRPETMPVCDHYYRHTLN